MYNEFVCGMGFALVSAHLEDLSAIEKLNCTRCFFPISFIDIGCAALRLYETFDLKKYLIVKTKI